MSLKDGLALFAGLVLGQYLTIHIRFSEHANEYVWLALRKLRALVFFILLAEWLMSSLLVGLILLGVSSDAKSLVVSTIVGLILSIAPFAFEQYWITSASVASLQRPIFQAMHKLGAFVLQKIERQMQLQMEEDNLAWQSAQGEWKLGVKPEEVSRRIRKLYEFYKLEIANERKKSAHMRQDIGTHSGQKFYLLVKRLGRNKFRHKLSMRVEVPSSTWDGRERRRVRGEVKDRRRKHPRAVGQIRSYDDLELMKRISRGEARD